METAEQPQRCIPLRVRTEDLGDGRIVGEAPAKVRVQR
jgi:hypothetical protein